MKRIFEPIQGSLLVSEPFLADAFFKRSVVLLSEHDKKGTLGFILNKPTDVTVNQAVDNFPDFDAPLYFGGPVETDTLFYIHALGELLPGSIEITKGIWLGGDFDTLKNLIEQKKIAANQIRFYAGYSGWEPDQLENEMREKAWLVTDAPTDLNFLGEPEVLWGNVLKSMGNEYAILSTFPEDPSLN